MIWQCLFGKSVPWLPKPHLCLCHPGKKSSCSFSKSKTKVTLQIWHTSKLSTLQPTSVPWPRGLLDLCSYVVPGEKVWGGGWRERERTRQWTTECRSQNKTEKESFCFAVELYNKELFQNGQLFELLQASGRSNHYLDWPASMSVSYPVPKQLRVKKRGVSNPLTLQCCDPLVCKAVASWLSKQICVN